MDARGQLYADGLRLLGVPGFRPGQREVISALLDGHDVLAVMPTGSGKSLCYQLPALLLPGITVVVSPLLALMRQQAEGLMARGVAATWLGTDVPAAERARRLRAVAHGDVRVVLLSPEALRHADTVAVLRGAGVALCCVDEAHLVPAWGGTFRPGYAGLGEARAALAPRVTLALTATATRTVQEHILAGLGLAQARVVALSPARENVALHVAFPGVEAPGMAGRVLRALGAWGAGAGQGRALVYARTRAAAARLARALSEQGVAASAYHAGMTAWARAEAQEAWERGDVTVMCATVAFGMGMDRPDVRVVVHAGMPWSFSGYVQEAGRAGRDGAPARAVLLASAAELARARRALRRQRGADAEELRAMLDHVTAPGCRQAHVVAHFTGEVTAPCGRCDRCLSAAAPHPLNNLLEARAVLEHVARAGRRLTLGTLVAALGMMPGAGSRARRRAMVEALVGAGLLEVGGSGRVRVSATGEAALDGGPWPPLAWPSPRVLAPARTPEVPAELPRAEVQGLAPPVDVPRLETVSPLRERLRAWKESRGPGLPERVLLAVEALRPRTVAELRLVPGLGRLARSGQAQDLLALVRAG